MVSLPHLVRGGVAHDFLDRRHPRLELGDAGHAQGLHAEPDRLLLELGGGGAVDHQLLERIPQRHHLVERDAALVPAVVAGAAAARLEDLEGADLLRLDADVGERLRRNVDRLLALLAQLAGEPLGEDEVHRGGHQERLDAHVEQAGDGAWRVVGVQRGEHQVAGERGLDPDLGGLEVADLADHDDVRVLAQEAAQRGREVEPDVLVHLHLVDAGEVELHRVLGGADVVGGLVQLGERRVERGGLARSGGTGDQHHAVGPVDGVLEGLERLRVETQLGHVELEVRLVEQTHDDFFADQAGADRDAEVHLAALAQLELDAAVLREAALGDVELGHDLHAADDRCLQLHRRLHRLVEHAVDAVADAEVLLVRLDVDVARALLDRVEQDQVHELDHWRILRALLDIEDVLLVLGVVDLDLVLVDPLHHLVVRGTALGVVLLQALLDRLLGGDHHLDVVAGEELDVVDGVDVGGVAHRQDQRGAGAVDRDALVLLGHVLRNELDHLEVDVELFEIDRGDAVLLGEEARELALLDETELGEVVADAAARLLLLVLGLLQLLQRDEILADQQFTETTSHSGPLRDVEPREYKGNVARKARNRPVLSCHSSAGNPTPGALPQGLPTAWEIGRQRGILTAFALSSVAARILRASSMSRAICAFSASAPGKRRSSRIRSIHSMRRNRP